MSVLVKRPVETSIPDPTTSSTTEQTVHDPLDKVMVDPVTRLKITRRQWEELGQARKPAEVPVPPKANYSHEPEKKQESDKPSLPVTFSTLPKESKITIKSICFVTPKLRFSWSKRKDE